MDDVVEPGSSPRRRRENVPVKALGEDSPAAQHCVAVESSRINDKPNRLSHQRQVSQASLISTVDSFRPCSADRAKACCARRTNCDQHDPVINGCIVDHKAARNECRRPERMTHGADSLCETNISEHLISSKVSQSQICTPKHTGVGQTGTAGRESEALARIRSCLETDSGQKSTASCLAIGRATPRYLLQDYHWRSSSFPGGRICTAGCLLLLTEDPR